MRPGDRQAAGAGLWMAASATAPVCALPAAHRVDRPCPQGCSASASPLPSLPPLLRAATLPPNRSARTSPRPWKQTKLFYGGKPRRIRYKEVAQVYWRRGAGQIPLRLFVGGSYPLSQTQAPDSTTVKPPICDHRPAPLRPHCCKSLRTAADRSQPPRREDPGRGQSPVVNIDAVPKQPPWWSPPYSALLLAALQAFGTDAPRLIRPLPGGEAGPPPSASTSSPCCARNGRPPENPNPSAPTHRPRPHPGRHA